MTDKPELLPCPFCGGAPVKGYNSGAVTHIYCMDCRAMTRYQCSEQDALDAWNTRAPLGVTKAEAVEMLEKELSIMSDFTKTDYNPQSGYSQSEYIAAKETTEHWLRRIRRLLEAAAQHH